MKVFPVRMGDVMRHFTLEVTFHVSGIRWARFRLWLGAQIIKCGARVIGCDIELKGPRDIEIKGPQ